MVIFVLPVSPGEKNNIVSEKRAWTIGFPGFSLNYTAIDVTLGADAGQTCLVPYSEWVIGRGPLRDRVILSESFGVCLSIALAFLT